MLQPLNAVGDREGCTASRGRLGDDAERFKQAYKAFVEGGWVGITGPAGVRRPGPAAFPRRRCPANIRSPPIRPSPCIPASPTARRRRCWCTPTTRSSDLSAEAHVGRMDRHDEPDRAALRHRSRPHQDARRPRNGDGSYAITGQKIFISSGEHDLADNIVHLVLARIEGAPAGMKGISLFVVPKFLPERAPASATASSAARSSTRWAFTAIRPA